MGKAKTAVEQFRKIVMVASFSGNAGKTTLTDNLMLPRLNNPVHVPIETINSNDRKGKENIKGAKFNDVTIAFNGTERDRDIIVDVGSSNIEVVISEMKRGETAEDFTHFLIPILPDVKYTKDAIALITELAKMGVPPEKIIIIFNMVQEPSINETLQDIIEDKFGLLLDFHKQYGLFTIIDEAAVFTSDIFQKIKGKTTIDKVLADQRDFNELIASAPTRDESLELSAQRSQKRIAKGVNKNLDTVFNAIFG